MDGGKPVTAEKTFIAETANGTVDIEFTFNSLALRSESVVAFEDVYFNELKVASHTDLTDDEQTVKFKDPSIKTTATDKSTGKKEVESNKEVTIVDIVEYKNLVAGKEYTIKGTLMLKETNQPLIENGKYVTSEKTFVAMSENGTVDIEFTFNSASLGGKSVVVFEKMYFGELEVASHEDINDKGQTVYIKSSGSGDFDGGDTPLTDTDISIETDEDVTGNGTPNGSDTPNTSNEPNTPTKTGDITTVKTMFMVAIMLISALIVVATYRKKKHS